MRSGGPPNPLLPPARYSIATSGTSAGGRQPPSGGGHPVGERRLGRLLEVASGAAAAPVVGVSAGYERWPTRWLVADDVGLGKTIEAGMIFWPLLSRGTVRRLLVLAPPRSWSSGSTGCARCSTFVWRFTPRPPILRATDFWGTHNQVVASFQTLRADRAGRHDGCSKATRGIS